MFTFGWPRGGYIPRHVLAEQLFGIASEHVSIETVYIDAAFDSIGVMDVLEETNTVGQR